MEKELVCEDAGSEAHPASAEPDLRSGPESRGAQEVRQRRRPAERRRRQQQEEQQEEQEEQQQEEQQQEEQQEEQEEQQQEEQQQEEQPLLIHGLTVERYRQIYNSVFTPPVLAALSSADQADYVSQVLELKQRLWTALSRPRLVETLREDGRVEVTEVMDLT